MSNSKNTIIGFVLIFAILIGYYFLTAPSKEELLEQRRIQDSLMIVQRQRDSVAQLVQAERMVAEEQKKSLIPWLRRVRNLKGKIFHCCVTSSALSHLLLKVKKSNIL